MKINLFLIVSITAVIFLLSGCQQPSGGTSEPEFTTVSKTIDLAVDSDVYLIFTNSSVTDSAPIIPSVYSVNGDRSLTDNMSLSLNPNTLRDDIDSEYKSQYQIVNDLQLNPIKIESSNLRSSVAFSTSSYVWSIPEDSDTPGSESSETFYVVNKDLENNTIYDEVPSICKKVVTNGTITLAIYVDNDSTGIISDIMVTTLAEKFLNGSTESDIYTWVTDLYGEPWGPRSYSNILPLDAKNHITILLTDLFTDGSDNGGVVGLFNSTDNYYNSANDPNGLAKSNERLIFYIDSVMYANDGSDNDWQETDYWPQEIFSTLTHEFQHMIHFYNKWIFHQRSSYSDTWFNEMCSVVTEDLTSWKQQVMGPRGHLGAYAGIGLTSGRLPLFNVYNDDSLTLWGGDTIDYSSVYAFGAFLARNYGGASLFKEMVTSSLINEEAIISAISAVNPGVSRTFEELLIEWGKSVLLSDLIPDSSEVSYNRIESDLGYYLYPIKLENYTYNLESGGSLSEPWVYTSTSQMEQVQPPASNYYLKIGSNVSPGSYSFSVDLPRNNTVTVLTKDS